MFKRRKENPKKSIHRNTLIEVLEQAGAITDRWGMQHLGVRKFDLRKTNMKVYVGGYKVFSVLLSKITVEWLKTYIEKCKRKEEADAELKEANENDQS